LWSVRRLGGLAVVAAVILATVAGYLVYRQVIESRSSRQSGAPAAQSQAAVTEPTPPAPVSSIPVEKPAAAAVPVNPAPADPREQRLAQLRQDARDQFQRGQRRALSTVSDGLRIAPEDPELQAILDSILTDAQRITGRSKEAAVIAGAPQYAKAAYQEALQLERDARQQVTSGRKDLAARTLWRAEETFDQSERDARLERAQQKQAQDEQSKQRLARGNDKPGDQPVQPRGPETPPTAAAQPSAADLEKARVAGVVQRYAMGYSALNTSAVLAVYPGEAVWQFQEFDSYALSLADCAIELSSDGASATAVCTATHSLKRKRGTAVTEKVRQTFTLRKRGAGWIIASIGYDRAVR